MEYEICRVCLNSKVTLVDIFVQRQQVDPGKPEPCLAEMLNEIAHCYVKHNDELPQKICLSCVIGAQNAWKFKRTCEQSYRHLTGIDRQLKQEPLQEQEHEMEMETTQEELEEEEVQHEQQPEELAAVEQISTDNLIVANNLPTIKTEQSDHSKTIEAGTNEKPYKCNMCSKTFAHKKILRVHQSWHAENKSSMREVSPKASKLEKRVKKTKLEKASKKKKQSPIKNILLQEERPYQCSECKNCFQSSAALKRHRYIHTGECHFQCPYCGKAFYRSDYCKKHIKKVHKDLEIPSNLRVT